jgi:hypothetical protein
MGLIAVKDLNCGMITCMFDLTVDRGPRKTMNQSFGETGKRRRKESRPKKRDSRKERLNKEN